jgi:hypothetical protein
MILVWNNTDTFKQHLEEMKTFRQAHNKRQAEQVKNMSILPNAKPPRETGLVKSITNSRGKVIFAPIWKIVLSKGSNN